MALQKIPSPDQNPASASSPSLIPLSQLSPGKEGEIWEIRAKFLDKDAYLNLIEQGVLPHTTVRILDVYSSQNKIVAIFNSAVTLALDLQLAGKIFVKTYEEPDTSGI